MVLLADRACIILVVHQEVHLSVRDKVGDGAAQHGRHFEAVSRKSGDAPHVVVRQTGRQLQTITLFHHKASIGRGRVDAQRRVRDPIDGSRRSLRDRVVELVKLCVGGSGAVGPFGVERLWTSVHVCEIIRAPTRVTPARRLKRGVVVRGDGAASMPRRSNDANGEPTNCAGELVSGNNYGGQLHPRTRAER